MDGSASWWGRLSPAAASASGSGSVLLLWRASTVISGPDEYDDGKNGNDGRNDDHDGIQLWDDGKFWIRLLGPVGHIVCLVGAGINSFGISMGTEIVEEYV